VVGGTVAAQQNANYPDRSSGLAAAVGRLGRALA
jgi:hypothetical protein